MLNERITANNFSFFDRIKSIDYFLILIIISIGAISVLAIYSTESGNFSYYTKNHLVRLCSFFFTIFYFFHLLEFHSGIDMHIFFISLD